MALYVNSNVSSLSAQYSLRNTTWKLDSNYRSLGSGLRINTAKDDAANLHVSNNLTSQINGLDQGNRNSNDGIALAQTVDGGLTETVNMLQKMRTLAVQAANGTYTEDDRAVMQQEMSDMCAEISRIAEKTTYAGATVLDGKNGLVGDDGNITFQVGSNSNDTISLDLSEAFHMKGLMGQTGLNAKDAKDADATQADFVGLVQTTNANGDNLYRWSVSNGDAAQKTLANIDAFITAVDAKRTELGSVMNRMESTIRNYSNTSDEQSDSRSRVRDTDFASETAALTQNNILQQASQSILSQANQQPAFAVSLLQ